MSKVSRLALGLALAALCHLTPAALAAPASEAASEAGAQQAPAISHGEAAAELKRLQTEQDRIKQQASDPEGNTRLHELEETLQKLDADVDKLSSALTPQRAQLQAQLDVLGPPPAAATTKEAPAVVRQRADLNARRAQLDAQLKQAGESKANIANLSDQLARLQRGQMKDQLALRSESILNPQFWKPLVSPDRKSVV